MWDGLFCILPPHCSKVVEALCPFPVPQGAAPLLVQAENCAVVGEFGKGRAVPLGTMLGIQ